MKNPTNEQIIELLEQAARLPVFSINRLNKLKRRFANDRKTGMITNQALLRAYRELIREHRLQVNQPLENILKKRSIRTLSGVAPVTVMTAPLGCPNDCLYCPKEKNMPKSYLSNQPAAMRAVMLDFDPFKQTAARLRALKNNGHATDKIEIIILGGTWSAHPAAYQLWFITKIFQAGNEFNEQIEPAANDNKNHAGAAQIIADNLKTRTIMPEELKSADNNRLQRELHAAQTINQTANNRIIGITIETRPDHISPDEVQQLRLLGVTKVELGVQTIYPDVIKLNRRHQTVEDTARATKLLKDAGFKVAYHIMPGMYGSTVKRDVAMFQTLFSDDRFKPDFLKIYPCVVVKDSDLFSIYQAGKFKPYSNEKLVDAIVRIKCLVPKYCRIARLHRDIPKASIMAGCDISNIRELIQTELKQRDWRCNCIRCREPMGQTVDLTTAQMNTMVFKASGDKEYFLTFDSPDKQRLLAFLRLRLPRSSSAELLEQLPELQGAALIRELHTYGILTPIKQNQTPAVQHCGFGKKLMAQAEAIASQNGFKKIAVIAGIGVREYYHKLGYQLQGTYMVKKLIDEKPKNDTINIL